VSPEIIVGNVWAFYAVVLVVGFRRPQAWALPILTKGTAAMGCIWFIARREWGSLLRAVGCAALIACVSFAISPNLWHAWITYTVDHRGSGSIPLVMRLPFAVFLAAAGALRSRPTWLAWAVVLGSPVFGTENFVVLAALPRLQKLDLRKVASRPSNPTDPACLPSAGGLVGRAGAVGAVVGSAGPSLRGTRT
jgi:hypothetical protein